MWFILTVIVVFALLVGAELWWRSRGLHGELSRKFVHISVGSFVAFWPFFLSWRQILFLSAAFLLVISVSKYLHIFKTIHSVQRPTWGEIFFALAVGGVALVTHDNYIYLAALLHMSLGDGLAAVVGVKYGKQTAYKVLGHGKSLVGSATFALVAVLILLGYSFASQAFISPLLIVAIAIGATAIENVGIAGLDNLLVPMMVALSLTLIS